MSRGSRRRVVLEQPEQHLAEHLDLAGRAVAAVHLDRPVAVGEGAALAGGRRRRAGRAWSQPSSVSGSAVAATSRRAVVAPAPRLRCSSRWSRPREASSGCRTRRWLTSAARGVGPVEVGEPLPQVVARVRQPQVEVVVGGQRAQQLDLGGRHAGCGRTARSAAAGRSARRAAARRSAACRCGRDRRADRSRQGRARAAAARPGRSSSVAAERRRCRWPADQSTSSCGRWAAYDANRPASRRATA